MIKRKIISAIIRRELLSRTHCANSPGKPAPGCQGYICPLWDSPRFGKFDESGIEIDHIIEVCHGGTNDLNNLQALCPCCHAVKTRRCSRQSWDFNSIEIDNGRAHMETENLKKKKT